MRSAVVLAGIILVGPLAGCLGLSVDPVPLPPAGTGDLPVFRYLCPGDAGDGGAEPCLADLPRGDAAFQQPFVAIHPGEPRIMAVGVTRSLLDGERARNLVAGDRVGTRLAVYVTEDGGAIWRETFAPPPDAGTDARTTSSQGDANLLFDPNGTLHVTAVARSESIGEPDDSNGLRGQRVYYVRSVDLGRTWGGSVWLGDNDVGHDRPWLVREPGGGALYVVWQDGSSSLRERTSFVAWSLDGGDNWSHLGPEGRLECYRAGVPMLREGILRLACIHFVEGDAAIVRVYAFDARTVLSVLLSEVSTVAPATHEFPSLTLLADETLVLHYDACPPREATCAWETMMHHSVDGGMSWSPAIGAGTWASGPWDVARVYWSAADDLGGHHLLVGYERGEPLTPGSEANGVIIPVDHELRHVVLGAQGNTLHDAVLERWRAEDLPAVRPELGMGNEGIQEHPRCGRVSCFYGLAWMGGRALVAYDHHETVRLAVVQGTGSVIDERARIEWPPVRPYVPPPPPTGLDKPVAYEFTGHLNAPYHCLRVKHPAVEEALSKHHEAAFEFEVPVGARFVNGTLSWTTQVPEVDGVWVAVYDAAGEYRSGSYVPPEPFAVPLRVGDEGRWTALVYICENPPTDFTLEVLLS